MRLNVTSEIGKLRSVLVHLPGREIDVMIPSMMEELLFDDILYGQLAREEHRRFQQLIRYVADDVLDLGDLLEEVLDETEIRKIILQDFCRRFGLSPRIRAQLSELPASDLAETMIAGIVIDKPNAKGPFFELTPIPNFFFMRDPLIVLGDGVAISTMATQAREREPLLSRYVFQYHRAFRGRDLFWTEPWDHPWPKTAAALKKRPTLEGGDVLVARRDLLIVGQSERTNRAGIDYLAESLRASDAGVRTLLVVEIPNNRSCMHLDTVFTIISRDECLIYPPVIAPGGSEAASVYRVDLTRRELSWTSQKSLLGALKKSGMDLEPISCGGRRLIDQAREQWTDGANAFALSPGLILLYERNVETAGELSRHGYEIVREDDLLRGRTELETWTDRKYAIQIEGTELSRARGGPRCMTMPLERDEI